MRERAIEEFESVFEQASIPVLDIEEIPIQRISAVLDGSDLDRTVLTLAEHLQQRFTAQVQLHWTDSARPAVQDATARGLDPQDKPFASTAELVGQNSNARAQLVLLPESPQEGERFLDLDQLVQGTRPPVLLLRRPIDEPRSLFRNILHSLTGNFRQKENFAYSFTLVDEQGSLLLLHTIDVQELEDVRDALKVARTIEAGQEKELLERMTHHGERYLKAVVAASRDQPYDVNYRLALGDVVAAVRGELERGDYGLLVVGHHHQGHSHIAAADYQLMHAVRDIPILAL